MSYTKQLATEIARELNPHLFEDIIPDDDMVNHRAEQVAHVVDTIEAVLVRRKVAEVVAPAPKPAPVTKPATPPAAKVETVKESTK